MSASRRVWRHVTPGVTCALLIVCRPAEGAPAGAVTGHGNRGDWSVTANVHLQPDGTASGHLQIVGRAQAGPSLRCRYDTFRRMLIIVNQVRLDASGTCESGNGSFPTENRVVIIDNGEPGTGHDKIDVTALGSGGIAVPGGVIDGGNFQVAPARVPSLERSADRGLAPASDRLAHPCRTALRARVPSGRRRPDPRQGGQPGRARTPLPRRLQRPLSPEQPGSAPGSAARRDARRIPRSSRDLLSDGSGSARLRRRDRRHLEGRHPVRHGRGARSRATGG